MYSLINANINRNYNPNSRQNALCDIKRLLTSRDTAAQNKACGYLIEVINRYKLNSNERNRMVEYLLENDIIVFLCEATSNLDFSIFRSVLSCVRLIWRERRFFAEEHAAHAMTAAVRALAQYSATDSKAAVDACLHFICDLLNGIISHETTSPLSIQSAYSTEQLLSCLNGLLPKINSNSNTILSSALVVNALISYQPDNLIIRGNTAKFLIEVIKRWLGLLLAALNHMVLVGDCDNYGMFLIVMSQIGIDGLRLIKLLNNGQQPTDFVQTILTDDREINMLKQCASDLRDGIVRVMSELVVVVKDNEKLMKTEEYTTFLKFLLNFLIDFARTETSMDFCDLLLSKGYLTMLPHSPLSSQGSTVRKASTLVLGEMLKTLADKYLCGDGKDKNSNEICANDIQLGLVELQYGIENSRNIGLQLQKRQPYCMFIYIYFYCQSSENPGEAIAPLLPYLIDHILRLPKFFKPPPYIIKALWLLFAMSTVSNSSLESLDERVFLEKATDRLIVMLQPEPAAHYTHNPALLFWAFTSLRIPHFVRIQVLSQWLATEDTLPEDLTKKPLVWELLLYVLIQNKSDITAVVNCRNTLNVCIEEGDESAKHEFAAVVWSMLPEVLSKALIDCESVIASNICYLLDLATILQPEQIDMDACLKVAVLVTTIFSKNGRRTDNVDAKYYHQYVCLKLCLSLLELSNEQNDCRVLSTYVNRVGFLPNVLEACSCMDDKVACAALQLLSVVVHCFTQNKYQPKTILHVPTEMVVRSLRRNNTNEVGSSLLDLVYIILDSGLHTPLMLTRNITEQPSQTQQWGALRALMLRIQLMLCCRDSKNQLASGWEALISVFQYAVMSNADKKLIATLTTQPWTYTLIRFQLTQNITQEFLSFVDKWLPLLKITIANGQEGSRVRLSKYSLITRTLITIKKNLITVEEDLIDTQQSIQQMVGDILADHCLT